MSRRVLVGSCLTVGILDGYLLGHGSDAGSLMAALALSALIIMLILEMPS